MIKKNEGLITKTNLLIISLLLKLVNIIYIIGSYRNKAIPGIKTQVNYT